MHLECAASQARPDFFPLMDAMRSRHQSANRSRAAASVPRKARREFIKQLFDTIGFVRRFLTLRVGREQFTAKTFTAKVTVFPAPVHSNSKSERERSP